MLAGGANIKPAAKRIEMELTHGKHQFRLKETHIGLSFGAKKSSAGTPPSGLEGGYAPSRRRMLAMVICMRLQYLITRAPRVLPVPNPLVSLSCLHAGGQIVLMFAGNLRIKKN